MTNCLFRVARLGVLRCRARLPDWSPGARYFGATAFCPNWAEFMCRTGRRNSARCEEHARRWCANKGLLWPFDAPSVPQPARLPGDAQGAP
jgi:hypothetical protein